MNTCCIIGSILQYLHSPQFTHPFPQGAELTRVASSVQSYNTTKGAQSIYENTYIYPHVVAGHRACLGASWVVCLHLPFCIHTSCTPLFALRSHPFSSLFRSHLYLLRTYYLQVRENSFSNFFKQIRRIHPHLYLLPT